MKSTAGFDFGKSVGRSPHGERGLKSGVMMSELLLSCCRSPHGERGLKYKKIASCYDTMALSLSSRRAWIEISASLSKSKKLSVALLTESVD